MWHDIGVGIGQRRNLRRLSSLAQQLFPQGETGLLIDPGQIDTLYQSINAELTAVGVNGDPVGVACDIRLWAGQTFDQVMAQQPELLSKGTFADDLMTGWASVGDAVLSVTGDKWLDIANNITDYGGGQLDITTNITAGKLYYITFDYRPGTDNGPATLNVSRPASSLIASISKSGSGSYAMLVQAETTGLRTAFLVNGVGDAQSIQINNISVKEIPGDHLVQTDPNFRPSYNQEYGVHWIESNGTDQWMRSTFVINQLWERVSCLRQIAWTLNGTIFGGTSTGSAGALYQAGSVADLYLYSGNFALSATGEVIGADQTFYERHDGTGSKASIDGGAENTANAGIGQCGGLTLFANSAGTNPASARVYGVVMREEISTAQKDAAIAWAMGLPISPLIAQIDYFVNPSVGNDANDGSLYTPVETFAGLPAQAEGQVIGIHTSSEFREGLPVTKSGMKLVKYGDGASNPKINGADVVTSWIKTGGFTNLYEASVTVEPGGIDNCVFIRPIEDDASMDIAASQAAADAAAGSYFVTGSYPNYAVYVHASDSGNPASNGSVYEVPKRLYGIHADPGINNIVVDGIDTEKAAHFDGSTILRGTGNVYKNAKARHGSKHNWFVGSGTVTKVDAEYAQYSETLAMGVAFLSEPSGENITIQDCSFRLENETLSSGFLCHKGAGATTKFGTLRIDNVDGMLLGTLLNFNECAKAIIEGSDAINCLNYVAHDTVPTTIAAGTMVNNLNSTASVSFQMKTGANLTVGGGFLIAIKGSNIAAFYASEPGVTLTLDGVVSNANFKANYTRMVQGDNINLTINDTDFGGCDLMIKSTGSVISSDNNFVPDPIANEIDGIAYSTLAAYQTATGQDANTVVGVRP